MLLDHAFHETNPYHHLHSGINLSVVITGALLWYKLISSPIFELSPLQQLTCICVINLCLSLSNNYTIEAQLPTFSSFVDWNRFLLCVHYLNVLPWNGLSCAKKAWNPVTWRPIDLQSASLHVNSVDSFVVGHLVLLWREFFFWNRMWPSLLFLRLTRWLTEPQAVPAMKR